MINIFKYFTKTKQDDCEQIDIEEIEKRNYDKAIKQLNDARKDMFKSPCPLNGNSPCWKDCVHFYAGNIFKWWMLDVDDSKQYGIHNPTCKLWK